MSATSTNDRPLRVVHAIDSLRLGGAESLLATLVRELDRAGGVQSFVFANDPHGAEPKLVEAIERHGGELVMGQNHPIYDPRVAAQVVKLARRAEADVIHSQLCVANVGSRLAAHAVRRPHITTVVTTPGPLMEDSRARALADAGTSRLSRILVAVSPSVADEYSRYARVSPRRFRVVPNAPAAERPAQFEREAMRARLAPNATHIVATVARLQVEKGIDELIEATALLAPRAPGVHVVVAGGGPEEARLRAVVADRELGDHITLLGHTPDVSSVLAASDVFCLPSRNEGLPVSLLEAMMFGLPSVATSVGGIPGLVTDGESGLLVPARHPAALAAALERLVTDEELARRIGAAAASVVDAQYSPAAVARSYRALYEEVAAR